MHGPAMQCGTHLADPRQQPCPRGCSASHLWYPAVVIRAAVRQPCPCQGTRPIYGMRAGHGGQNGSHADGLVERTAASCTTRVLLTSSTHPIIIPAIRPTARAWYLDMDWKPKPAGRGRPYVRLPMLPRRPGCHRAPPLQRTPPSAFSCLQDNGIDKVPPCRAAMRP